MDIQQLVYYDMRIVCPQSQDQKSEEYEKGVKSEPQSRGETSGQKGARSKYTLKGLSPFHPPSLPPNRPSNSPHLVIWTPCGEHITIF